MLIWILNHWCPLPDYFRGDMCPSRRLTVGDRIENNKHKCVCALCRVPTVGNNDDNPRGGGGGLLPVAAAAAAVCQEHHHPHHYSSTHHTEHGTHQYPPS